MKTITLFIISLLILLPASLFAGSQSVSSIRGIIIDADSGMPLMG